MRFCLAVTLIFYTCTALSADASRVFSCSLNIDKDTGYMLSLFDDGSGKLTIDYMGKKHSCDTLLIDFYDLRGSRAVHDVFEFFVRRTRCTPLLPKELDSGIFERIALLAQKSSGNTRYFVSLFKNYRPTLCNISMIDNKNIFKLKDIRRAPSSDGMGKRKKSKTLHSLKKKLKKYLKK